MPTVVICPSCQSKGTIPDGVTVTRIRCPKCKESFAVGGTAPAASAGSTGRPASASKPVAVSALDDLENFHQETPVMSSGVRRSPVHSPAQGSSGPSPLIYAILGGSGVAVVALLAILVVVLTRGGNNTPPARNEVEARAVGRAGPNAADVAPAAPAPVAVQALVSTTPVTSSPPPPPTPAPVVAPTVVDSQEIIRRLKDASVYIIMKVGGKPVSTGSGFVIEARGDTLLLATNRHVVVHDPSELPSGVAKKAAATTIDVVFRSGLGQREEQILPAQIIAADLTEEYGTDLAFLRVQGVRKPPTPINPFAKLEPTEGMTYIGAGFPLGGMLNKISESKGNPSVTITGGRIAALRRDEHGHVNLLQVDGSLQPGNSGGPIIEEKTGKLLGVAVASLSRAGIDTIGFIVPVEELRRALAGRIGALDLTLQTSPQGTADLLVKAQLVDPKQTVKGVFVHVAPASAVRTFHPNLDGSWPAMPASVPVELLKDDKTASASGRVQVSLSGQGADARKVMIQTARRDLSGQLVYSKPKEFTLPDRPGRIVTRTSFQRAMVAVQRKSVSLLGPLLDPDKDCQLIKDEENLKIRIDIPGKLHTLSPEIASLKGRKLALHNAPITLTDVEGDFGAGVMVTGDLNPGSALPTNKQVRSLPFTVQSAGLIVYQDRDNFLRLERAGSVFTSRLTLVHRLIIEAVKGGRQAMNPIYLDVPDQNTLLVVARQKGRIRCMFSSDGGATMRTFREFALDLPAKLKVGLTAANISAKPFTANFENFALINGDEVQKGLGSE